MTQLYNREGLPTYVDSQIVQDLLQTGKYTEQPVSVEEGQEEKEVKDVITAHIYSYLQKQKDVYAKKILIQQGGEIMVDELTIEGDSCRRYCKNTRSRTT